MPVEDPERRFSDATRRLLSDFDLKQDCRAYESELSQRVLDLQDELHALQRRHNQIPFPNRIPHELLSKILLIYSEDNGLGDFSPEGYYDSLCWLQITHVCKLWRTVALNLTSLWSPLNFINPQISAMMLEQSKEAPLIVRFDGLGESIRALPQLADALSLSDRLRLVGMFNDERTLLHYPTLLSALGKSAPNLETLILSSTSALELDSPEVFTLGGAPSLKTLKLMSFNFEWSNIPLGPALTSLYLDPHTPMTWPKWDAFLLSLSQMPLLETVELHHVLPREEAPLDASDTTLALPVTLSRLKHLAIEDTTHGLCDFFRVITMPQAATLDVVLCGPPELTAAHIGRCILNMKTSCFPNIRVRSPGPVQSMTILGTLSEHISDTVSRVSLTFKNPVNAGQDPSTGGVACMCRLSMRFRGANTVSMDPLLTSLIKQYDFSRIYQVKLSDGIVARATLHNIVAKLRMKHLVFAGQPLGDLLEVMDSDPALIPLPRSQPHPSSPSPAHSVSAPSLSRSANTAQENMIEGTTRRRRLVNDIPLYFPSLRTITLSSVEFRPTQANLELLIILLKSRIKLGNRHFQGLKIRGAYDFYPTDMEKIQDGLPELKIE